MIKTSGFGGHAIDSAKCFVQKRFSKLIKCLDDNILVRTIIASFTK